MCEKIPLKFEKCLRRYGSASQDDLWRHLSEQAIKDNTLPEDLDVKTIMDSWTLQKGYPVVTVTRNFQSQTAVVSQDRFVLDGQRESRDLQYKWYVPLHFTTPEEGFENTTTQRWLKPNEQFVVIAGMPDADVPVIFNVQQTGYYRVNYDSYNWQLLIKQLNEDRESIGVLNRAQIIDDAMNLARAGLLDYSLAMELISYLAKEQNSIPYSTGKKALGYIDSMLKRTEAYGDFRVNTAQAYCSCFTPHDPYIFRHLLNR